MAKYGICNLSVIPCREEPSDKSQMVTQLLFGESFEILAKRKHWRQIRNGLDGYESWIDEKQFIEIDANAFEALNKKMPVCASDLVQLVKHERSGIMLPVVAGSSLPNYHQGHIAFGNESYEFDGEINHPPESETDETRKQLADLAMVFRNAPYLWGGRSPFGIDCSGLMQVLYKMVGVALKRDAYQQAEEGQTLSFVEEADIGDLAFFDNDEGKIIHVGMMVGENAIIHASGKVRIDKLDHQGIFNVDTGLYSHKLRLIRRVLD
ncbi:MAG: C40 family peptidase [Flavobacteriales bacterium]|nr:C40 family peptidase [Flavobacteriales bacterium]